jgi:hypothetical protein
MALRRQRAAVGAVIALFLNLSVGPVFAGDESALDTRNPTQWAEVADRDQQATVASSRHWLGLGDWGGLSRDTAFLLAYQLLGVGIFYVLPESVSQWSDKQKESASFSTWWDNTQHPTWDKDTWWINAGHAYFGAAYYVRARERGFGEVPSFLYSALASSLYEFGIEAVFERPSYQDLIVTPVGGALLGAFIFEPIRKVIKAKAELKWYDHVLLVASDPLGAGSYVIERLIGIKSEIRVDARPPALAQSYPSGSRIGGPGGPQESPQAERGGLSVEWRVRWY